LLRRAIDGDHMGLISMAGGKPTDHSMIPKNAKRFLGRIMRQH
jgi:hypothetical protein